MKKSIKNLSLVCSFLICFTLTMSAQSNSSVKPIQKPNAPTLNKATVQKADVERMIAKLEEYRAKLSQEGLSAEMREKYQNSINILSRRIEGIKKD